MTAAKPRIVLVPHFRRMEEIFDSATLGRLHDVAEVVWGRNEPMPQHEFAEALQVADGVVFGTWNYGSDAVAAAGQNLKWIHEVAGSHHHPDLDYATCFERGILVGSCAPAFGPAVAEMAMALTLAAARLVPEGDAAFKAGREQWLHAGTEGAVTLFGKTIGFVGAGGLSRSLQALLGPFDVELLAYDPWLSPGELEKRGIGAAHLEDLFDRSEVVFVLAVPSPENRGLVSRALMERLGPSDILAVISRAHLVDFDALTQLLHQRAFRAVIDVFPQEPMPADHPIRTAPGVVLSAHRAGAIPEALEEIGRMVVDDLADLAAGREPARMQYATPGMIERLLA